ncbi:MAG: protein kinase, partial [Sandaracinaceae bacterium]|nr:protein kinase [Sandaracinaceae bacterium]
MKAPYRILHRIGQGGMSEAFVAFAESFPDRLVCLKRPLGSSADDPLAFLDEGRALSRLCHPSIPALLDMGIDEKGPYIVTELIDGIDLSKLLQQHRPHGLPERVALRIAHDIASALAHAHEHRVIHRDVA